MIPVFHDYISLRHFNVGEDFRNQFIDSIMQNMEDQKADKDKDQIVGLQATAKVTHAGRLTGHWHYYTPKGVDMGSGSFISPFKKPVLAHHNDHLDAIGRVATATYIDTPSSAIPYSIQDRITNTLYYNKKSIKDLRKISNVLYDKQFEGLGYIQTSANITDEKAISNIVRGIYHTISIGYGTDSLVCSECGTDWYKTGAPCEHDKGVDYGNGPMFLIFGIMQYDEYSYVNKPADDLASNIETIYSKDSIKSLLEKTDSMYERQNIIVAALGKDSLNINEIDRIPMSNMKLHAIDSNNTIYVPESKKYNITNHGDNMTLKKLKESENLYEIISEHLSEDKILSEEKLAELQDSDFIGKRLFPVIDEDHVNAAKAVLETVNDCKEKTELLEFLDQRLEALKEASDENTDSNTEETTEDAESNENVEKTDVDNESTDNVNTEDTDALSYSFQLSGGNWGLPDGQEPETEKEKQILEFLVSLYAKEKEDALGIINGILDKFGDSKNELIDSIASESIEEYESRIDNYKNEQKVWKEAKAKLEDSISNLTKELKENLVSELLSNVDSEDPDTDIQSYKDKLEAQSLEQLRASKDNFELLFGKKAKLIAKETNDTLSHQEDSEVNTPKYTSEELDKMEQTIESSYNELRKTNQGLADNFRRAQLMKLNNMRSLLKSEENEENNK